MSLGLDVNGDDWFGGCRKLEWSAGIEERTGDLNGLGELGESVYGEKADIRLLFGEGSIGDFNAIIMVERD